MKLKQVVLTVAMIITVAFGLLAVPFAQVAADTAAAEVCNGVSAASGSGCDGSNTSLNNVIGTAINIFSIIIGIVAVIMIMVAGFKYITAAGDSGQIGSAKNTIIYAVIGLVIVGLAQTIVRFVLGKL